MRLRVAVTLSMVWGAVAAPLQGQTHHDPDSARLITSDIPRFWRVFDSVPRDSASIRALGPIFQRVYVDSGSVGLGDFERDNIYTTDNLADLVSGHWRYYAAVKGNTLAVDTATGVTMAIRASYSRLKALCTDVVFPDVYFVIGAMNSAGISTPHGLVIGVEMNARDDSTPLAQLDAWHRANTGRIVDLPGIVAHELTHFQQPTPPEKPTLLVAALEEGGADFIAQLTSGVHLNRPAHLYGDAHEAALWREFSQALDATDLHGWFYNGNTSVDRPADLGYYEGYKIAEAFYRRATDKLAAVCQIMHSTDAHDLLRRSGYAGVS
jgi:hypothetical protein